MDFDRVHIDPVAPDPGTGGKYGSGRERPPRKRGSAGSEEHRPNDRIEISETGRRTYREHAEMPEIQFARRVLAGLTDPDVGRVAQLAPRLEYGTYLTPAMVHRVAARIAQLNRRPVHSLLKWETRG